jgi:hypothetical protein
MWARSFTAAGALLLALPAAAHALVLGAQDDPTLTGDYGAFALVQRAGARVVRFNLMPTSAAEVVPAALRAHDAGFRVYLTVTGNPRTAADLHWPARALRRLRGVPAYVSAWNEPDWPSWWRGGMRAYVRYYLATYRAARRYAPAAKVLLGETSPWATSWLRKLARLRAHRLPADGYAHHPYQFDSSPLRAPRAFEPPLGIGAPGRLRALVRRATGRRLPLYYSEFGYLTDRYTAQRSGWLCQARRAAQRARARLLVLYQLVSRPAAWNSSIYDAHGRPTVNLACLRS